MRKFLYLFILTFLVSCGQKGRNGGERIITVSIAPFKYFVEEIAGDDFIINIMVPVGADPHIYEPFPEQIIKLRRSVGYISNGYLGFEMIWLDRFYEINRTMKRLSLGEKIDPLVSDHNHEGAHVEGADPHYWMSPKCGLIMALSVKEFLTELNPVQKDKYETNYQNLISKIRDVDADARQLFSGVLNRSFMIFHPNLGYMARDYGLEEISLEYEGKEPSSSRMKELIDRARKDGMKTIFIQREYDTKNAKVIADEIGAEVKIIDPLSEEWLKSIKDIVNELYVSFTESSK
ncbi:MAG TPA: zinc ABC transporter substrate-binding protein [Bacteroidales bacterium]|nr:zinc ABC transporter substrate-binding protein [Bacteroidales bacterium]